MEDQSSLLNPRVQAKDDPSAQGRKRVSFPHILDLRLPTVDLSISATREEGPHLESHDLAVFSPLETIRFTVSDSIFPSQRVSWGPVPSRRQSTISSKRASQVATDTSGTDSPSDAPLPSSGSSDEVPEEPTPDYPQGLLLWSITLALILSIFLIALDNTIVASAIPAITNEFHGLQDVAFYGAVFFMTSGGFQSVWGKIYRYFPLKLGYMSAIVIFEAGSLLCAVAPTSPSFIVGRAVAGVGAAGIGSGSFTIIAFIAEPKKRPLYTGLLGAIYGVASVLGPLLGGVFSATIGWRWCFYINLPVGGLSLAVIVFFFRTPSTSKPLEATWREKALQVDPLGTGLVMAAMITYLLAVYYGGQIRPWSSATVIGLLVGSGVLWILFVLCEYLQGERAAIVPRLFRRRDIYLSSVFTVSLTGAFFSMIYYIPIYFQAIQGSSPIIAGVQNLPFIIAAMIGALGAGFFISSTGLSTVVMVAGSALGTLGCGLCYTFGLDTGTGTWIGYQIIGGFGLGGAFQIPIIVGQVSVNPVDLSSATAILLSFQVIGGALFVSAAQAAFVNSLITALPRTAPGINPAEVVATGAGQLRAAFSVEELPGVLDAYLYGVKVTFALCAALSGVAFLSSLFFSWKRLDTATVKENGGAA